MKLFFASAISILFSVTLFAQQTSKKDTTRYYHHGSFNIGYQNQSFDNLNARILRYFPKSIPQNCFALGFGGKTAMNNWLIQGDLGFAFGSNGTGKKGYTNAFLLGLNLDAGLFLNKPGAVRVYPFAGLSLDVPVITARIRTDNINFDSVLSNPQTRESMKPISISSFFVSWKGGIAIDFGNPKSSDRPYSFGIKAGYKQSFNNANWQMENTTTLVNAPSDKLQQWFAGIVFYTPTHRIKYRKY